MVARLVVASVSACLLISASASAQTKVQLASPSSGDVTYGAMQVKITKQAKQKKTASSNLKSGQLLIQQVGGLDIAAKTTENARQLRKAVKIYAVVTLTRSDGAKARNVALFVTRKKSKSAAQGSLPPITFTLGNANPIASSYAVRGTDRNGYTEIFNARNILSMALGNWSRYLKLLKVKGALAAAMKSRDVNAPEITEKNISEPASSTPSAHAAATPTSDATALPGPWTGGDRMNNATKRIYGLIFGTLPNRAAYQAAKKDPAVTAFISQQLNNPKLATRWTNTVSQLPLVVPERYAAAAKEERRFGAPKGKLSVSRRRVQIADDTNSSSAFSSSFPYLIIVFVDGKGTVKSTPKGAITCTEAVSFCAKYFPKESAIQLVGIPDAGWGFDGWTDQSLTTNCVPEPDGSCIVSHTYVAGSLLWSMAIGLFSQYYTLTVNKTGSGSGSVTSAPQGIDCGTVCSGSFKRTPTVTLTASADAGSTFTGWFGCSSSSGTTCNVTSDAAKTVSAEFTRTPVALANTAIQPSSVQTTPTPGPTTRSFSNPDSLSVTSGGIPTGATPYPSTVTVSDMPTQITGLTVSLNGLSATEPGYFGAKLVGPQGQQINLLYNQGFGNPITDADLTFTDSALAPASAPIISGSYRPNSADRLTAFFATPAPSPPAEENFAAFNGTNPNGTWSLWVDQIQPGSATLARGWTINLTSQ